MQEVELINAGQVKRALLPRLSQGPEQKYVEALTDYLACRNYRFQRRGLDTLEVREFLQETAVQDLIEMAWPKDFHVAIRPPKVFRLIPKACWEALVDAMKGIGYQQGKPLSANVVFIGHIANIEAELAYCMGKNG